MEPKRPPEITTPDGASHWSARQSEINHSKIARGWDTRGCTPTTPTDSLHCCPICLGVLWNPVQTPCGHAFCVDCLIEALKISPTCPLDRSPLPQPPGPPIAVSFPLNYPNDDPGTRITRETWALTTCGAFSSVTGEVKQAMEELRARCPFRESEGCVAELPWDTWDLRTHITVMRHGEPGRRRTFPLSKGHDTKTPNTALPLSKGRDTKTPDTALRNGSRITRIAWTIADRLEARAARLRQMATTPTATTANETSSKKI